MNPSTSLRVKRLIVNADDFGASERRNAGILEAHRRGIVTSASILANGDAFDDAVSIARETPTLKIGLHLNLSEGLPITFGGRFPGKHEARTTLWDATAVLRETEAQLRRLLDAGLRVTHLDGHQHIHVYGTIAEPVACVAARHGIRRYRRPADVLLGLVAIPFERLTQIEEYRRLALQTSAVYARHGLSAPDHFGGVALSGHLTSESLARALKALPEGVTEIMVHPGFCGHAREREVLALTDPRIRTLLRDLRIELT